MPQIVWKKYCPSMEIEGISEISIGVFLEHIGFCASCGGVSGRGRKPRGVAGRVVPKFGGLEMQVGGNDKGDAGLNLRKRKVRA